MTVKILPCAWERGPVPHLCSATWAVPISFGLLLKANAHLQISVLPIFWEHRGHSLLFSTAGPSRWSCWGNQNTEAICWVLATAAAITGWNCTGDTSWCLGISKMWNSSKLSRTCMLQGALLMCSLLNTLRAAWAQPELRVLTSHLLSEAGNNCTLLGTISGLLQFDPGTAVAAKMLDGGCTGKCAGCCSSKRFASEQGDLWLAPLQAVAVA